MPTKKFIVVAGSAFVAVGLLWIGSSSDAIKTPERKISAQVERDESKDSDGDGLADWEENLQGTDVYNPDSDGDGLNDNEEKTLNDQASETKDKTPSLTNTYLKTLEDFFRSRVGEDGTIRRDSLEIDPRTKELVVKNLATDTKEYLSRQRYSAENIKTSSEQTLRNYFNETGTVLAKYFSGPELQSRLVLIKDFENYTKDNTSGEKNFISIKSRMQLQKTLFEKGGRELNEIAVPKGAEHVQAELLNIFAGTTESFGQLAAFEEDPLLGYVGAINYRNSVRESAKFLENVKKLFDENKLAFEKSEGGAFLQTFTEKL